MNRIAFAVVALVASWAPPVRADTLPTFVDLPGTYTPGTPFTFQVQVPQLFDFGGFNVELFFDTDVPNPPLFVSAAAPDSRYVFPTTDTFQSGSNLVLDSPRVTLYFQDSAGSTVTTVPGTNDTVAVVTVQPGSALTGPIVISLSGNSFFLYNNEDGNIDGPAPVTVDQFPSGGGGGSNPAPAPAGVVLLGIGGLVLGVRSRFVRRA